MNYTDQLQQQIIGKAEQLKLQGEFEPAVELLHGLILEDPTLCEAFEELGDNYLSLREIQKAKKSLKHALTINPKSANAHYLLGFLYSLEQKWIKSVEELSLANELFPNNAEILRCLGWSMYNQNVKKQGLSLLERSQALKPADPNILCDLGVCYMNSANFNKAKGIFEKVVAIDPYSEQAKECNCFLDMLKDVNN